MIDQTYYYYFYDIVVFEKFYEKQYFVCNNSSTPTHFVSYFLNRSVQKPITNKFLFLFTFA